MSMEAKKSNHSDDWNGGHLQLSMGKEFQNIYHINIRFGGGKGYFTSRAVRALSVEYMILFFNATT